MFASAVLASVVLSIAEPYPQGPKFSWDTLPVFFHSSNASGPYGQAAIELMAKFPMVTIEKFQGPCGQGKSATPACHQEAVIVAELKKVKAVNPNVSTIFYYNSVLDFPQYDLHARMLADPSLALHNADGARANMSGGGHNDMDVFDFSNPETRNIFAQTCINATKTGYVDGCFLDRAVDGTPCDGNAGNDNNCTGTRYNLNVSAEKLQAYNEGHIKVLTDLQAALGQGPLIANHAFGPPHDLMVAGSVSFAMIEGFAPNNASIQQLITCAGNGRGVQAHGHSADRDTIAAFLVGAGYRAYFGMGGWSSGSAEGNAFGHWDPVFADPLGAPLADGVYTSSTGVWSRQFNSGKVNVTFNVHTNKGTITGFGTWPPPPPPSPRPPPPAPPAPPAPPVAPTASCPAVKANCGYRDADVGRSKAATWGDCCDACSKNVQCERWAWSATNAPLACHMHAAKAQEGDGNPEYVCGSKPPSVIARGSAITRRALQRLRTPYAFDKVVYHVWPNSEDTAIFPNNDVHLLNGTLPPGGGDISLHSANGTFTDTTIRFGPAQNITKYLTHMRNISVAFAGGKRFHGRAVFIDSPLAHPPVHELQQMLWYTYAIHTGIVSEVAMVVIGPNPPPAPPAAGDAEGGGSTGADRPGGRQTGRG